MVAHFRASPFADRGWAPFAAPRSQSRSLETRAFAAFAGAPFARTAFARTFAFAFAGRSRE